MSTRRVIMFTKFERFWHWSQMTLIFILLFTGFAIRGTHSLMSFETSGMLHTFAALALIVLWIFAIFWHFTTGTWRHYVPTSNGLFRVARYYAFGIFKGEHHPYRKTYQRKHNPLQALSYLGLKIFLFPAIWVSGLLYLSYPMWSNLTAGKNWLEGVATIHVISAFAILIFIIAHIYLLTTGHSFKEHVKPMITGYDDVDLTEAEESYLQQDEPGHIKPEVTIK
ncbi:cytochrome b/b6 domain-containing protein [uncultured Cocleimonas sp.]|uniref:cytochrome b/b6 domain-containing protein n=1 Tax=uncultured Cocleimonas sp. TaxID=1051587 RepID=UPI00262F4E31|nr:cytochrome b/b6 domain-containing protein [uncultured Cocleimonas sp.]